MPVRIVHAFEVVEVEEQQAELQPHRHYPRIAGFGDLFFEQCVQVPRVEQAGAVIRDAEVLDQVDVARILQGDGGIVAEHAQKGDGRVGQQV